MSEKESSNNLNKTVEGLLQSGLTDNRREQIEIVEEAQNESSENEGYDENSGEEESEEEEEESEEDESEESMEKAEVIIDTRSNNGRILNEI